MKYKAAFKDVGERVAEYVAVVVDQNGDQVWQSSAFVRYHSAAAALRVAQEWVDREAAQSV